MTEKSLAELRKAVNHAYLADEQCLIGELLAVLDDYNPRLIGDYAQTLAIAIREKNQQQSVIAAFMQEYQLNSHEGVVLMGIAEALLRIPDRHTQDLFLQEKLSRADWQSHLQHSESPLVNLATKALLFAGGLEQHYLPKQQWSPIFQQLLARLGMPLIRTALKQAMQFVALQFVFAESIAKAVQRCEQTSMSRYSFDMLGEAALTAADAERYFQAYCSAIHALAEQATADDIYANASVSIKLSALCPRYEPLQQRR